MILEWPNESKSDWLWFIQSAQTNAYFFQILLLNGLFILPHGSICERLLSMEQFANDPNIRQIAEKHNEQVMLCPNPIQRQVIDLRLRKNWQKNKKLKKYKNDFYLSINYKFKYHFKMCQKYHTEKDEEKAQNHGTWITDDLIDLLCEIHKGNENNFNFLQFLCFELWEKETNEIVAASFGYLTGSVLNDYTFMTLKRDHRSCGSILTKVIGDILSKCLYDLWNWGFRLDYMAEYDKYGGTQMNRTEFAKIMQNSSKKKGKIVNCKDQNVIDM